ncbi:MAG: hypothetical protein HQL31_08025 [Planctomycetes bacterium]|nr:hypothetical protein [Planctomycetota bacterium]
MKIGREDIITLIPNYTAGFMAESDDDIIDLTDAVEEETEIFDEEEDGSVGVFEEDEEMQTFIEEQAEEELRKEKEEARKELRKIHNSRLEQAYKWMQSPFLSARDQKSFAKRILDLTNVKNINFQE